jgi:F420H(2)-dependent quinone reductase
MTVRRSSDPAGGRSATRPPAWFNRLTLAVLRSPLHRLADPDVCALTFRGRRSERRITVPVLYATHGNTLIVLIGDAADKQWWRNFHQPRDVEVRCRGRKFTATGRILASTDPAYREAANTYQERHQVAPETGDRLLIINPRSS